MTEQPGTVLGDRYKLERVIGRGGMAEVWLAHDQRLDRAVAIKRLRVDLATDPTFQARFRREAQSAAGLNHPNIVSVYDTGEEIDSASGIAVPYIVMELVEGQTLKQVLAGDRRLLPERALEFTQGILDALSYSHRAGIVHRDIKPANVMLTKNNTVKVMDFGIARAVADTSATMTQTAAVIGTAQYLSPEQARGETVDSRSDIYSTGCLLYELLVGRPPFVGDSPVSVAYQHVREQPLPPSELDPEITPAMDAVMLKALAKDPADRYQTAREMRDDISRILQDEPVLAPAAPTQVLAPAVAAPTAVIPPKRAQGDTGTQPATNAELESTSAQTPQKKRMSGGTIAIIVLLLAVLGVGAYAADYLRGTSNPTPSPSPSATITVPGVLGYTQVQAEQQLNDRNLLPVAKTTNGAADTKDTVVDQSPKAGVLATPGEKVTILVNVGPQQGAIPTGLKGLTAAEATKKLRAAGFEVEQKAATSESADDKKGTVVQVSPDEGASADKGSTVTIFVATGQSTVPDLSGMTLAAARQAASAAGFSDVKASYAVPDAGVSAPVDTVFKQDPAAGSQLDRGTAIKVVIAKADESSAPVTTPASEPASPSSSQSSPSSTSS